MLLIAKRYTIQHALRLLQKTQQLIAAKKHLLDRNMPSNRSCKLTIHLFTACLKQNSCFVAINVSNNVKPSHQYLVTLLISAWKFVNVTLCLSGLISTCWTWLPETRIWAHYVDKFMTPDTVANILAIHIKLMLKRPESAWWHHKALAELFPIYNVSNSSLFHLRLFPLIQNKVCPWVISWSRMKSLLLGSDALNQFCLLSRLTDSDVW